MSPDVPGGREPRRIHRAHAHERRRLLHDGKLCLEEFSDMIHAYLDNPRFEVD